MFDKAIWDAMFVHAQREYPAECCGIVTEDASGVQVIHPCENIQDKLHAADPETHPRTSRTAYRMDDMQVIENSIGGGTSGWADCRDLSFAYRRRCLFFSRRSRCGDIFW